MNEKFNISKNWLKKQLENKKTCKQISIELGCSVSLIYQKIKKYNINLPKLDLVGKKWNKLTVVKKIGSDGKGSRGNIIWECRCDCGKLVQYTTKDINSHKRISCGCYQHSKEYRNSHYLWNGYEDIHGKWWSNIKKGAIKRNYTFNINIEDAWNLFIKQNKKCALSGMDIKFAQTSSGWQHGDTTASIDRIDNNKGYTKSNIQWVHKDVNIMKNTHPQDYFLELCSKIHNNNNPKFGV